MNPLPDADLLQAYLDGRLTAAEAEALEERLRQEPALADALVILAREEAILTEWAGAMQVAERAAVEKTAGNVGASAAIVARTLFPSWPGPFASRRVAVAG